MNTPHDRAHREAAALLKVSPFSLYFPTHLVMEDDEAGTSLVSVREPGGPWYDVTFSTPTGEVLDVGLAD
jgi:hypothetical protein